SNLTDSDKISRSKKQNLTKANLFHIRPPTSQRHKGSSEASRTKSDQTATSNRTSNSRYSLRSQTTTSTVLSLLPFTHDSDSLVPSDLSSNDNQDLNPMGDETSRLKKDKLGVLQKVINQTKVLSWFSRLPKKFGFKNFQTLKAAEWQILMTLYLPLALVPLWGVQIPHREERVKCPGNYLHKDLLLKSLISLVTLKNLPKVIKELGPPRSLALWAYEIMNCEFGDIPQNNKPC
ncbi:hypothetical protein O181_080951, partial [Austropuccinia psidii MF-1]|nr:hypothetical protein [Austropuccinia psidii MF-1]